MLASRLRTRQESRSIRYNRVRPTVEMLEQRDLLTTAFALTSTNGLFSFETTDPANTASAVVAVTGLAANDSLTAIEFRQETGQLLGLAVNTVTNLGRLYDISPATGAAAAIGGLLPTLHPANGFDFNPLTGQLRVTDFEERNLRVDPDASGSFPDTNLAYAAGDANAATTPDNLGIVGSAYTRTGFDVLNTTLFGIDFMPNAAGDKGRLVRQGAANVPPGTPTPDSGQLFTIGALGIPGGLLSAEVGFDIRPGDNTAFLSGLTSVGGIIASRLHSVNLATGAASSIGVIGTGAVTVRDIALALPGTIQYSSAVFTVGEGGGQATLTVTRTGGSEGTVTIAYTVQDGSATNGQDHMGAGGMLTFNDGETTKTFAIPIIRDGFVEGTETINLALGIPSGGAELGGVVLAVLQIEDLTTPPVQNVSGQVSAQILSRNLNKVRVRLTNNGRALWGPFSLVLAGLSRKIKLRGSSGVSQVFAPGASFFTLANTQLGAGQSIDVILKFSNPRGRRINFSGLVAAGVGTR